MFVIGHRGARGMEPENTIRAIRAGMRCAEFVEVDARLSRDRVPVILHDPDLDRTTDGSGAVGDYSLEDLKRLDAGGGEPIPTLEEVCTVVSGHCGLVVEIKEPGSEGEIAHVLSRNRPADLVLVSFNPGSIVRARQLLPEAKTGIIVARDQADPAREAAGVGADMVLLRSGLLTPQAVSSCRKQHLLVVAWTLNNSREFIVAAVEGVDGIASDFPCRARRFFNGRDGVIRSSLPG